MPAPASLTHYGLSSLDRRTISSFEAVFELFCCPLKSTTSTTTAVVLAAAGKGCSTREIHVHVTGAPDLGAAGGTVLRGPQASCQLCTCLASSRHTDWAASRCGWRLQLRLLGRAWIDCPWARCRLKREQVTSPLTNETKLLPTDGGGAAALSPGGTDVSYIQCRRAVTASWRVFCGRTM